MAITGVSAISGMQILASGACSAKSAATASYTSGGNNIQNFYNHVNTASGSWTGASNPQIPVTGINGVKISESAGTVVFEVSGDYYPGDNPSGFITGLPNDIRARNVSASGHVRANSTTADLYGNFDYAGMYFRSGSQRPYNIGIDNTGSNFYIATAKNGYERIYASSIQSWNSKGDMFESAFGYDANDKISGYNGSAFAGGSDVPEGVMVESGLEYNAVNEISAYNGSAIAQYGAEKQWLQHDDTLLHVANSAQYALGVNVSAVAQLLGVDETVLWESNTTAGQIITAGIDLSETMNNFKEVKFVYRNGINYAPVDYISPHSALVNFNFVHAGGGTNAWMQWSQFSAVNSGTKIYMMKCKALNYGNATATGNVTVTATTANDLFYLYQVIGIGRKA